jgi:hypothetical protein
MSVTTLKFARDLELPRDAVTQRLGFLGTVGSGKSYSASKLAELMLDAGAQIVVIDPVGIWYGLRLAANGTSPSDYQIPIFGGLHGDVPLEAAAGKLVADLVVDRGISLIIDISQFESDADKARFCEAFGNRFFFRKKAKRSAVHLFLEECQEVLPQNPMRGEERMLHEFTRIDKLGRNFGIGLSLISQRPQEVNKKALNLTECLLAFQTTGKHERKAIEEWIIDKGVDVDLNAILPKLETGVAHLWSPRWLKLSRTVKALKKKTADVSKTPEVGEEMLDAEPLAPIDLEQLRTSMAATIEKAKAEDPKELQKRIRSLEGELRKLQARTPAAPDPAALQEQIAAAVEHAVNAERQRLERYRRVLRKELDGVLEDLGTRIPTALINVDNALSGAKHSLESVVENLDQNWMPAVAPTHAAIATLRRAAAPPDRPFRAPRLDREIRRDVGSDNGAIGKTPQRMLNALKFLESIGVSPATRQQVAGFVGISANTGSFRNYLSELRGPGYIEDASNAHVALTPAGRAQASDDGLPSSLAELHETYLRKLGATPAKMLRILIDTHPDAMERSALGAMLHIDHSTGSFRNYLSELRSPGLLEDPTKSSVRASDLLFPPGLN